MPTPTFPAVRSCALAVLLGVAVGACGTWQRVGSQPAPSPERELAQVLDMPSVYRRLGRLAAGAPLPFVGNVVYAAGPGDSTIAILGLSLENRALSFQREGDGFIARYRVEILLQKDGMPPIRAQRDEAVRVTTFQETLRNDESVLFQQAFHLLPGQYQLTVSVRDRTSSEQSRVETSADVPAFPDGSVSWPIVAYEVTGRARESDPLSLVLNPRGTVAYGSDTLLAYIEGYRLSGPTAIPFQVRDERDSLVLTDSLHFQGGLDVEGQVVRLTPDSAPLGELKLVVGSGEARRVTSAIVSLSTQWVVTNYEDILALLRYFDDKGLLDTLRKAPAYERSELWRRFYRGTDPNQATPENEALDQYFARLAVANSRFRDEGVAGWRTDRGEVFIRLGEPDEIYDASPVSQGRVIQWVYLNDRLSLTFVDETGFGRFRLTTQSRAEFERVVDRHRRAAM